jgi:hypothetical protein
MKPLPTKFTRLGFDFTQIERCGQVALFEKRKPGHSTSCFEAVVIEVRPEAEVFGRKVEEREVMPPDEAWGKLGFTYIDRQQAKNGFESLVQRAANGLFTSEQASNV